MGRFTVIKLQCSPCRCPPPATLRGPQCNFHTPETWFPAFFVLQEKTVKKTSVTCVDSAAAAASAWGVILLRCAPDRKGDQRFAQRTEWQKYLYFFWISPNKVIARAPRLSVTSNSNLLLNWVLRKGGWLLHTWAGIEAAEGPVLLHLPLVCSTAAVKMI